MIRSNSPLPGAASAFTYARGQNTTAPSSDQAISSLVDQPRETPLPARRSLASTVEFLRARQANTLHARDATVPTADLLSLQDEVPQRTKLYTAWPLEAMSSVYSMLNKHMADGKGLHDLFPLSTELKRWLMDREASEDSITWLLEREHPASGLGRKYSENGTAQGRAMNNNRDKFWQNLGLRLDLP